MVGTKKCVNKLNFGSTGHFGHKNLVGQATDTELMNMLIKKPLVLMYRYNKDYKVFQRTQVLSVTVLSRTEYLPIFAVKILEYQISKMKEDMAHPFSTRTEHTWRN
jgi:hypothetical protein